MPGKKDRTVSSRIQNLLLWSWILGDHTASLGLSVANCESLANTSCRLSGGKKRSKKLCPLFKTPVAVPCRAPAMPPITPAMVLAVEGDWKR